jgi:REP element-mobilizing transposase RayT
MTGIVTQRDQKLMAINGMPDHIHILVSMNPAIALSDLVRDVKAGSSWFVNQHNWVRGKFNWQEGFGGFSYSKSHVDRVVKYIHNQEAHHKKKSFRDEYLGLLKAFEIDYDERYIFKFIE